MGSLEEAIAEFKQARSDLTNGPAPPAPSAPTAPAAAAAGAEASGAAPGGAGGGAEGEGEGGLVPWRYEHVREACSVPLYPLPPTLYPLPSTLHPLPSTLYPPPSSVTRDAVALIQTVTVRQGTVLWAVVHSPCASSVTLDAVVRPPSPYGSDRMGGAGL